MKKIISVIFFLVVSIMAIGQVPQGSVCSDPIVVDPLNAPLVNFAINSENYGNDYSSNMVNPSTVYLNGNDIVFQFTITAKSFLNASISGTRTGLIFTAVCPSTVSPAPRLAFVGSATGGTITKAVFEAGTYFMIASTYPDPVFTDMIINLSVTTIPLNPVISVSPNPLYVGMAVPGMYSETKNLSISNVGVSDLIIAAGGFGFTGLNAADYSVTLNPGDTYPLIIPFGQTKIVKVNFNPAAAGTSTANLVITYNHPIMPNFPVPVSGTGYLPLTSFGQNFDGVNPVPADWWPNGWTGIKQSSSTSAFLKVYNNGIYYSAPNHVGMYYATDLAAKLILVSPAVTNIGNSWIRFASRMGADVHTGHIEIGYLTSRTDPTTFVPVTTIAISGTYTPINYSFAGSGLTFPTAAYLGMRFVPEVASRSLYLDDIYYELLPTTPVFKSDKTELNFGTGTFINESSFQSLQVTNTGVGTLIINLGGITITGHDANYFKMVFPPNQTWPITLNFGQSYTFNVKFTPLQELPYSANLNIQDNTPGDAIHTFPLLGSGYDATLEPGFTFDFTGTWPPLDWRKFIGLLGSGQPVLTSETKWQHKKFANNAGLPQPNSANVNIFSSSLKHWLMTPPINLGNGSVTYELEFDMAMTAFGTTNPGTMGNGQRFMVLISTDGGLTWSADNTLRTWDATTPISNTGEHVIINLAGYSGRVMLGFYAESTIFEGDVDMFVRNVSVNEYVVSTPLPFTETFENTVFPPGGWSAYDVDGLSPEWESTDIINHTNGGTKSVLHTFGDFGSPQDGWLVTPLLAFPAQGPVVLKFWSINVYPEYYSDGKNSVLVSTDSGNPASGDFVEVWSPASVTDDWVETVVDLTAYVGQTVYIAFRYEGDFAHAWFLDDISVTSEFNPSPVITVNPESLVKSVVPGINSSNTMTITNNGYQNLVYNITLQYTGGGAQNWLVVWPLSGNLAFLGSAQHNVSFNSTGLAFGLYTAEILISSNDPATPVDTIPVTFHVIKPGNVVLEVMIPTYTYPLDISNNAQYVPISTFGGTSFYLWSRANGLTAVDAYNIESVSEDGRVSGTFLNPAYIYNGDSVTTAGRWNPETEQWSFLGINPYAPNINIPEYQSGWGMSADGSIVVGLQYYPGNSYKAFKWSQTAGYEMIGNAFPSGSRATGISKNGNVIYGWAQQGGIPRTPAIWANGTIYTQTTVSGEATDASPSGNYVVGDANQQGFIWTPENGFSFINNTLNNGRWSPTIVQDDGSIFGYTNTNYPIPVYRRAFARDVNGTMYSFNDYAYSRGMADANSWIFYSVNAATPDSRIFVGAGKNPQGYDVSFILDFGALVPEITVNPPEIDDTLPEGESSVHNLTISNAGNANLVYNAFLVPVTAKNQKSNQQAPEGPISKGSDPGFTVSRNTVSDPPVDNGSKGYFILNYDGPNSSSIGLNGGGTFFVAARFPSSMVSILEDGQIQSVNVYISDLPIRAKLKIWGQGTTTTPGPLLLDQSFSPIAESWNTITLTNPVTITGEDIWIGYSVEVAVGVFVAGVDNGPANPDGDWVTNNGGATWEHISTYGINSNWNIRASISFPVAGWVTINPESGVVESSTSETMQVGLNAAGLTPGHYSANLLIQNNAPAHPLVIVPINLDVIQCQQYSMPAGWNSLSSYLDPTVPAVENVFAPLLNNLVIVQNMTQMYWPAQGVNTIGNFSSQSGYAVKLNNASNLSICGNSASNQYQASAGWNYLPILSECDVPTMTFFKNYLNSVIFVQELVGTKVFWPAMGVYSLTSLNPGKAYKMKVINPITLTFPTCSDKGNSAIERTVNTINTPWGEVKMTPASQVVLFMNGSLEAFNTGDVIGAFGDDNTIFGYMEIENNNQNQVMTLFGNDPSSSHQTGFQESQPIHYRLFRNSTAEVFDLQCDYDQSMDNASGKFYSGTFTGIIKASLLGSGIETTQWPGLQIFPNPAKEVVTISVSGLNHEPINLAIYDSHGQQLMQEVFSGKTTLTTSNLEPGVYYVKVTSDSFTETKKLVIK